MRTPLFVLVVVAATLSGCRPAGEERGKRPEPPLPVAGKVEVDKESAGTIEETPFVLTDQTGAEFRSEALAGKVWMGAIFFANCPGPCFRENQAIADLLARIDHPGLRIARPTALPQPCPEAFPS